MKLLFCERNALMQKDMEEALTRMNISFRCASYIFTDTDSDDYFCSHLRNFLKEDCYDAVFSFNFMPLIADVCHEMSIPYIAWNYDAGWEFHRKDAFYYPTNYIFHFDGRACEDYLQKGYKNIFHMPLAVNCHRLDSLVSTPEIVNQYSSQVAFLGSLYEKNLSTLPDFFQYLHPDDHATLIDYICAHDKTYTTANIWDTITDEYANNVDIRSQAPYPLTRLGLLSTTATMISGRQRITMLNSIADSHPLTLYTTSDPSLIPNASIRWRLNYYSQMPFAFRHAKINLNLSLPSIQTGLPLRVFDIMGAGGFLMTNHTPEAENYFCIGKDLETFKSLEELLDKTVYYLAHPKICAEIAANGHHIVKNEFSFEKQFGHILDIVGLHV